MQDELPAADDPRCAECKKSIEEGSVVAFGSHIWHVECFRCAKCRTLVDHDSNLLLLSNGKPICENCSYNCRVCDKKIDDMAIMTGDESYHSECFRCRLCQMKIEDLVFAKTSQGIYCIACHNNRMSKSRKSKHSKTAASIAKETREKSLPAPPTMHNPSDDVALLPNVQESAATNQVSTDLDIGSPVPSPNRRPPPLPRMTKSHLSSPAMFDDFDFSLGVPSNDSPSVEVPMILQDLSIVREQESQRRPNPDDTSQTSTKTGLGRASPDRNISVRERRRPTETELRLPKSQEELAAAVNLKRLSGQRPSFLENRSYSDSGISSASGERSRHVLRDLNNDSLTATLKAPVASSSEGSPSNRADVSNRPSGPAINVIGAKDQDMPKSASLGSTLPTTPAKTSHKTPAIPPRSVDRPLVTRKTLVHDPSLHNEHLREIESSVMEGDQEKPIVTAAISTPPSKSVPIIHNVDKSSSIEHPRAPAETTVLGSPRHQAETMQTVGKSSASPPSVFTTERSTQATPRIIPSKPFDTKSSLDSPVSTFESDLSKAFNLSPRMKVEQAQNNGSGLERSGTISRLASKMLKHKKSVSGSALSSKSPYSEHRRSVTDAAIDVTHLQEELKLRTRRMSQLEETLRQVHDSRQLDTQLEDRKSLLANLETQITQYNAETQAILHHRHQLSDASVPLGEWKEHVVTDLQSAMEKSKQRLGAEIEQLLRQRNDLLLENESLEAQRATHCREIAVLEQRHVNLSDMNESMLKQIQSRMEAHKEPKSAGLRPDTTASNRSLQFSPTLPSSDAEHKTLSDATSDVDLGYALSGSTTQDLQILEDDDEEQPVVDSVVKRLSGERHYGTATPKKLNLVKKTKKAFRWGKNSSQEPQAGINMTISNPSASFDSRITDKTMTGSRSTDKVSSKANTGGMFKRTWHSQHNLSTHTDSTPASPATTLFGADLIRQAGHEGKVVPSIVTSCIAVLEARALEFEGLYRKSGGAGEMKALIEAFESANLEDGEAVDFTLFTDIPAISSVLKQYLRKLPNPLISFDSYEAFIGTSAIPDPSIRVRVLKDVLRNLPVSHYQTLKSLLCHLNKISHHATRNLMTSRNLAVVLGPTIVWDPLGAKEMQDMHVKTDCIQLCIEHADEL